MIRRARTREHEVVPRRYDEIDGQARIIRRLGTRSEVLPPPIWDRLTAPVRNSDGWVGDYRSYPHLYALFVDLSATILAWARSQPVRVPA